MQLERIWTPTDHLLTCLRTESFGIANGMLDHDFFSYRNGMVKTEKKEKKRRGKGREGAVGGQIKEGKVARYVFGKQG